MSKMIYLVLLLLMIPASGRASNTTVASIEYTEQGKRVKIDVVCYQRMREAMKLMQEKFDRETPVYLDNDSMQMTFDVEQNKRTWELWNQTIKDCVEEKP